MAIGLERGDDLRRIGVAPWILVLDTYLPRGHTWTLDLVT
jgi:hypothetical protein